MALGMEDFAVNFSALPLGTSRKGSVHDGLSSAEDCTDLSLVVLL